MEKQVKFQLNCWGITGQLYKQGLYSTRRRAWRARDRFNMEYGGGMQSEIIEVPIETKRPLPAMRQIDKAYCFCADTLAAQRGKGAVIEYPQFKTAEAAREWAVNMLTHYIWILQDTTSILNMPINLAGDTGYQTIVNQIEEK